MRQGNLMPGIKGGPERKPESVLPNNQHLSDRTCNMDIMDRKCWSQCFIICAVPFKWCGDDFGSS